MRSSTMSLVVLVVLVASAAVTACGGGDGDDAAADGVASCGEGEVITGRPPRIATTVSPLVDIVDNLTTGTGSAVVGIVPEGTDSHTFEPSPSDAAALERADIVFLNGLGLETPTRRMAIANLADGAEVCELGTTVLPEDEYLFDFSFPEEAGVPNPHLWTSPPWVGEYAQLIAEVLSTRAPDLADVVAANLEGFMETVDDLDRAIREATATVPEEDRLLLTYHDAYAYFAADYGWQVVGAVQPSSFGEPSPREVAALIDQVEALGVPAIFGSEVFPSPVLEQIATATGVDYVDDLRDDDLPGDVGDPEHSWFGLMRQNYITLIDAFGGDSSALRSL